MNFLKNLTGSSGAGAASGGGAGGGLDIGSMAKQGMRALGLDPQVVLMKLFQYFAGNLMGENNKPAMDADRLREMAKKTKIVDDNLTDSDINNIFDKVKGKGGTIDFDGFQDSLKEMAKKKYEKETNDANQALKKLEDQIIENADEFLGN